jgi:hypothetical protein
MEGLPPAFSYGRKELAMVFGKKSEQSAEKKFDVAAQRAFLAHLAQTANVSASAKAAGVTTSPVYELRRKSESFRSQWHVALCEGYTRLEANLLAEALAPASGNMKDSTFKLRQMKIRLGSSLLAAHRTSVRGSAPTTPQRSRDPKEVKQRLEARFSAMRKRLSDDGSSDQ